MSEEFLDAVKSNMPHADLLLAQFGLKLQELANKLADGGGCDIGITGDELDIWCKSGGVEYYIVVRKANKSLN